MGKHAHSVIVTHCSRLQSGQKPRLAGHKSDTHIVLSGKGQSRHYKDGESKQDAKMWGINNK